MRIHTYTHIYTYAYIYIMYVYSMYVCMYVCMYVRTYVCTYTESKLGNSCIWDTLLRNAESCSGSFHNNYMKSM